MDLFAVFLGIFITRELRTRFKSSLSISNIGYVDTTVFNDPDNNKTLLTKVFFKQTVTHQLLHKHYLHAKHTLV